MYVIVVQFTEGGAIHRVYGTFDSLDNPELKKVLKKGNFKSTLNPDEKKFILDGSIGTSQGLVLL